MSPLIYHHAPGRHDLWEIHDTNNVAIMDCIPSETAAESITVELNRAYQRGYRECSESIQRTLSLYR